MRFIARHALAGTVAIAAALALAGCTDASPGPSSSPPPSAAPSPSPAATLGDGPLDEQLFEAVRASDLVLAQLVLEAGQTPDFRIQDRTPLAVAIGRDDLAMVQLLIDAGATVASDVGDHIYDAAQTAGPEIIALLLANGSSAVGPEGQEAAVLATAAFADNVPAMQALVDAGAPVNGPFLSPRDEVFTPIFAAAYGGSLEGVKLLIDLGADPYSPGPDGATPAEWAAVTGQDDVVDYLASIGA